MYDDKTELFGDTLILETRVPVAWEPMRSLPLDEELLQLGRYNEDLLHTISMLEESVREGADNSSPQDHALMRLEQKLNVLMTMVSQLMSHQLALPEKTLVKLNANALSWQEPNACPAPGERVRVSVYLHAALPQAACFIGQVRSVQEADNGSLVILELLRSGDAMTNALEKYIFRHHRRAVAKARPG